MEVEIARQPPVQGRLSCLGSPLASSHGDGRAQSYLAPGWTPLWVRPRWEGMVKITWDSASFPDESAPPPVSGGRGFPGGSDGKESACNAGGPSFIPGSRTCPGERNGSPLQYCCLENPIDRGAWQPGVAKSWDTTEQLTYTCAYTVAIL